MNHLTPRAPRTHRMQRAPQPLDRAAGLARAPLLAALAVAAGEATASAQTTPCAPPCPNDQTCIQGRCWLAAPATAGDRSRAPYPPSIPAQPPPYYPPPPGYPPPPYYPPPPGYPPPAYGQAPVAAPPAEPYRAIRQARPRSLFFQIVPYLGLHSYHGQNTANVGPGLHAGVLAGVRAGELVWIDVELTLDAIELRRLPEHDSYSEADFTANASPLFSIPAGKVTLEVGPKLGLWKGLYNQSSVSRGSGAGAYWGYDFGANVAAFTQVSRKLSLGGLASFDLRTYKNSCFDPSDGLEGCSRLELPEADKVVALSILLLIAP